MSFFPAPAAVAIIFNADQTQLLLVKRKDIPIWVLPGGGIESFETAEEALIREIEEETGYQVEIKRQCAKYTPLNRLAALTYVFICHIKQGQAVLSKETSAINFYPLHQLPSNFFSIHQKWLEEALISTEIVYRPLNEVTYWACFKYLLRHPFQLMRYIFTRISMKTDF